MNHEKQYEELLAVRWIRELDESEGAKLDRLFAADSAFKARWEEDLMLLTSVEKLPDVPLSSNFTSLVVSEVARRVGDNVATKPVGEQRGWWARLGLFPSLGIGFGVILTCGVVFMQTRQGSGGLAESLVTLTESDAVPSLEELQNFEAIQMLAHVPADVDWELIASVK